MKTFTLLFVGVMLIISSIAPTYSQSNNWLINIIDESSIAGGYISMCIDSDGKLHVSYYDYSKGDLKYASNESGSWDCTTIDSLGDVGLYSSIAIDSNNKIHIRVYLKNEEMTCTLPECHVYFDYYDTTKRTL
ncbi:MAG: hypothetical protein ABR936_17210 [Bacteroidota bacterium]